MNTTDPHPVRTLRLGEVTIELRGIDALAPGALRAFMGTTPLDADVDAMPLPTSPGWLRGALRLLRWYRTRISPRLGNRCVYEPSCSRYAEISFRKHGLFRGLYYTARRLHRCKPGRGGVDLP